MQGYWALYSQSKRDRYAADGDVELLQKQASVLQPLALRVRSTTAVLQAETRLLAAGGSEITYLATLAFSLQSESFAHH